MPPFPKQPVEIMEWTKAPVYRIRDRYRCRIVLKSALEEDIVSCFERVQRMEMKGDTAVSFDLNPFNML